MTESITKNINRTASSLKTDRLPALIEWRTGKSGNMFFTEASINLADDDSLMVMMVAAGFNRVFIGIGPLPRPG